MSRYLLQQDNDEILQLLLLLIFIYLFIYLFIYFFFFLRLHSTHWGKNCLFPSFYFFVIFHFNCRQCPLYFIISENFSFCKSCRTVRSIFLSWLYLWYSLFSNLVTKIEVPILPKLKFV